MQLQRYLVADQEVDITVNMDCHSFVIILFIVSPRTIYIRKCTVVDIIE